MAKIAMFVFNGDPMCFVHVLLNALDLHENGDEIKIIIEGSATQLPPELAQGAHPLHNLWEKALSHGLIEGVCKACSNKMQTLKTIDEMGLTLLSDMSGHPAMAAYRRNGFEIIIF